MMEVHLKTWGFKLLRNKKNVDKATYKNLQPFGSRLGILYRLGTVHKETKNGLSPFRPNLSVIGTSTYKLAKVLIPFLTPWTEKQYTAIEFTLLKKYVNETLTYIWLI